MDSVTRLDLLLLPEPQRVIVKLFVPGEDDALVRSRASALIDRIAHLDDDEVSSLFRQVLQRFGARHQDLESTFQHHYDLVRHRVTDSSDLSPTARLLVGAYFSQEYAVEGAALCNPSIVEHPNQAGLATDEVRVVISLRQIGEGHVSSIGFSTGVIGPGIRLRVADRSGSVITGFRGSTHHRRDLLAAGLADEGWDNEVSATVLGSLPEYFDDGSFEQALSLVPVDLLTRNTAQATLEQLRRTIAASYAIAFPPETPLDRRILWPVAPDESNGMEDARFVRFVDDDGAPTYRATYTAYDGRYISARMLKTSDFCHFDMTPMRGPAARNKGMALFPRPVGGQQLALCRSDGET
ncbi:MAG: glycosylase, partial [Longispora sp.]|nr:glycosylase [Longispora sp. (in: high G+C Gram-positive bacteria)]